MPKVTLPNSTPKNFFCSTTELLLLEPVKGIDGNAHESRTIKRLNNKTVVTPHPIKKTIEGFLNTHGICTFKEFVKTIEDKNYQQFNKIKYLDRYIEELKELAKGQGINHEVLFQFLWDGVKFGFLETSAVKDLLTIGDRSKTNFSNERLLYLSILNLRSGIVELLLQETNVDPNSSQNAEHEKPLHAVVKLEYQSKFHGTPENYQLHLEKITRALLASKKIDVMGLDSEGRTAVAVAAAVGGNAPIVKLLLEVGAADPNTPDSVGMTPLHVIASRIAAIGFRDNVRQRVAEQRANNQIEILKLLLASKKINKEATTPIYSTPLFEAVDAFPVLSMTRFSLIVIKLLLEAGAKPDVKGDEKGRTPLHIAAKEDWLDVVYLLLTHGADSEIKDSAHEETPLQLASRKVPQGETVGLLRQHAQQMKANLPKALPANNPVGVADLIPASSPRFAASTKPVSSEPNNAASSVSAEPASSETKPCNT